MIKYLLLWSLYLGFFGTVLAQNPVKFLQKGDALYRKDSFLLASEAYKQAGEQSNDSSMPHYNQGVALHKAGKVTESAKAYRKAIQKRDEQHAQISASAWYNLGNTAMEQQSYSEAVKAYKQSLLRAPSAPDAKKNLQIALKKLEAKSPPPPKEQKENQGIGSALDLLEKEEQKVKHQLQKGRVEKSKSVQKRW
jgi:tetratricopeptide (TPR) repeat protein